MVSPVITEETHSMTQSTSTLSRGLAPRWARLASGSMLVVGAVLASVSAMNASAAPGQGPRAAFHKVAHHPGGSAPGVLLGGPGLDRMLDEVQASAAQRAQIRQIAGAARDDLRKLREAAPDLRKDTLNVLTQPSIDAGAAEQARQKMLAQQDAVSKRTLTAMLDVAKVLTPEQRTQLGEKLKARQAEREQRREQRRQDRPDRLPGDGAQPPPAQ
jgi:periplasmic protein CpxP/Spy